MVVDGQNHAPAALRPGNHRGKHPARGTMGPRAGMVILVYNVPNSMRLEPGIVHPGH